MEKKFFDSDVYSEDKDVSLKPAHFLVGEDANNEYFDLEHRAWQSAPTVVITHGGRMYCVFSGDNSGTGDECPNNYNTVVYSDDGGNTWSENILVLDHEDSVRIHGPNLYIAENGDLWLFWAQSYVYWDSRGGVWLSVCKNPDGDPRKLEWSEPRRLCHGVFAARPVIDSHGDMLLPVSIWKNVTYHGYNYLPELEYSSLYASSDGGKTFTLRGNADDKKTTFDENHVVERDDGSLFMIMREEAAIGYSISTDRGYTWSEPKQLMPHTSSKSLLTKFPSGHLLLVTNDPEGIAEGRSMMTAFLSLDGGLTWPHKMLLKKEPNVSYPGGMIDRDGRAYIAFDRNRYTDGEIYLSSFTEEDILAGKCVCPGSYEAKLIMRANKRTGNHKIFDDGKTFKEAEKKAIENKNNQK